MKKSVFPVLLAGVLIGTIVANCTGVLLIQKTGILGNDFLVRVQMITPQTNALIWYVAGARVRECLIWLLMMTTPYKEKFCGGMTFLIGFMSGMFSSISYIQQGNKGVWLIWLIMAVAWGLYYPGMLWLGACMQRSRKEGFITVVLVSILFALMCAFMETYFFIYVVKKISW